jgi:hypothetical protein
LPSACWNFCRKNPGRAERRVKQFFGMYVLSIIYLRPLNLKSTASGVSGASRESLESGASRPSEGENGRLMIDVAENIRSLLHFRRDEPVVASRKDDGARARKSYARLSSVVRPHDGAARSRAAGLQGEGDLGWQTWYWSAPLTMRRPSVICSPRSAGHLLRFAFGSPSCCAMLLTPDAGGRIALPVRCIGRQVPKPAAEAKLPDLALPYLN